MRKLLDVLLEKPVAFATKDIVKLAVAAEENEFDQAMYQLFVDYLGRSHVISDEDMEDIAESSEAFRVIILDIYRSDPIESISSEVAFGEFIDTLISELFIVDKLDAVSLLKWIDFFIAIVDEGEINEKSSFLAKSFKMLSMMLPPIAKLLLMSENPDSNITDELKLAVNEAIEKIMKDLKTSFRFESVSNDCAKNLGKAIKIHHKAFIQNVESFETIRAIFAWDDRTLLALGLTTLAELCEIEELHPILRDFLFSADPDETDDHFFDQILLLFHHKNLKSEVIQLLTGIASFEQDFLSEPQRAELFLQVFQKNKKISQEIVTLMSVLNLDPWVEIINMINYHLDAKEIDIPAIILSIDKGTPKKFLQITCNHIQNEITAERAAEMFHIALKMSEESTDILTLVFKALPTCAVNPIVTCYLLKSFDGLPQAVLANHYREHPEELNIIDMIFTIFEKTNDLMLEMIAVQVLYSFLKVATEKLLLQLFSVSRKYIRMFRKASEEENSHGSEIIIATKKLTALLECRFWQFMAHEDMNFFYHITAHCIKNTDIKAEMYPMFLRLHVNLLKHIWVLLARNKEIPIRPDLLIDTTITTKDILEMYYKDENNRPEGRCLAIASLLELLAMFQPGMEDQFDCEIFTQLKFPLTKAEVIDIVETIEGFVYRDELNTENDKTFYKHLLMHAFEKFYVNYSKLAGLTSWEYLLLNYNAKVPFKTVIDNIMLHALKNHQKAGIFDKTLAFAILNLSNNIKDVSEFRPFFNAIEAFLKIHQPDVKDRNKTFAAITSYALEKLPMHLKKNADYDKRLLILDCLSIIVKNLEPIYKLNIIEWIDLTGIKLTINESNKVEAFKNLLKE